MRILKQVAINMADAFTRFGLWKGGGSGGSSALSEMTDVTFTNLQANDILKYNGSVWVNDDNLQKQIDTLKINIQYGKMPLMTTGTTKYTEGGMNIYKSEIYTINFDRAFKSDNIFIVMSENGGNPSRFYQYRYITVTKNGFVAQLFANYPNYDPPTGMWIAIEK